MATKYRIHARLPVLFNQILRPSRMPKPEIHLLNPLRNAAGGSEWRTLSIYDLLAPHAKVRIWALGEPGRHFPTKYPIERLSVESGQYPSHGTFVFVGYYEAPGDWVRLVRSDRTILICNTPYFRDLPKSLIQLSALGAPIEIVYAAQWMRQAVGVDGIVQVSPIDLTRFRPRPVDSDRLATPFTVGRMSRDVQGKHHPEDVGVYTWLCANQYRVRIMGGTILAAALAGGCTAELLPCRAEPGEHFLNSLDCFYYRTHPNWREPYARVVMEAMACGLPVVAHRSGGYSEGITHGRDGFLFDTTAEALDLIRTLSQNPDLRHAIGQAARQTAETLYSPSRMREIANYYLAPASWPMTASSGEGDR